MTYDEIRTAWNAQADDGNRWHSLWGNVRGEMAAAIRARQMEGV